MATVIVMCNSKPLGGWLEVHIDQSIDKVTGQATIKLSEQPGVPVPMRKGDEVQILIDNRPVITGYVYEFNGEHDEHSHVMTCVIRDRTEDLNGSTVGPKLKMKSPISLKQIGEQTLKAMGLKIKVIDHIGPEPFREGEVISAAIDDKGFHVLDQWAQKRQVLWNTDGKGNICIDRNRKQRAPTGAALLKRFEDSFANNVLKASYRNSDLERHNSVSVGGQKSANDAEFWQGKPKSYQPGQASPMQKNWGTAHDSEVRPERRLHARGSKGLSGGTPRKAAKWRSSAARRKGYQYTATVQGFYGAPGWLWWHNYIVPVVDDHFEIRAELLITDVRFKKTWNGGEITEVSMTLPDAYTEDEAGSPSASRTSSFGSGSRDPGSYDLPSDDDLGIGPTEGDGQ